MDESAKTIFVDTFMSNMITQFRDAEVPKEIIDTLRSEMMALQTEDEFFTYLRSTMLSRFISLVKKHRHITTSIPPHMAIGAARKIEDPIEQYAFIQLITNDS